MAPLGSYADFDACVLAQTKKGKSKESALKICGFLEKKLAKGAEFAGAVDVYEKARDKAAVWKTVSVNNIPDNAFAYISPGGTKEKVNGKTFTKPRSLRHLPHHNASVKSGTENDTIDKAHLRNALARVSQTNIPAAAKASAEAHLRRHANAMGIGDTTKKSEK